ncbi:MAG: hypothetical protein VCF24_10675 [Candidatus Latescibacterota bacterium]|jgi:hypothetical protein
MKRAVKRGEEIKDVGLDSVREADAIVDEARAKDRKRDDRVMIGVIVALVVLFCAYAMYTNG